VSLDKLQYTLAHNRPPGQTPEEWKNGYLTKWPEVFPVRDQTAPTIAKLLVEKIICCHGVPNRLLSDIGANFLSNLLKEGYSLMGIKKLNTTAYHPQTDGLVERFNKHCYQRL
jgi:transposase InsO family protein